MKKPLAVFLAMILFFVCFPALSENSLNVVYKSDFLLNGIDGWYANNARGEITGDGAFLITGRTLDWMAPKRVFDLKPGVEYTVSAEVYQDKMDSAVFMLSVEQDGANWINLVTKEVPKGEWTKLEVTFTLEPYNEYSLYVETLNAPEIDYQMRNFILLAPADAE